MFPSLRLHTFLGAVLVVCSLAQASILSPFISVLDSWSTQTVSNQTWHELAKRAVDPTSCPTGYKACSNIGAPGLCCANSAFCAADQAGHVTCCPSGASCTGSISAIITDGTIAAGGSAPTTTAGASQPLTASAGSTSATATSGNGLVFVGGQSTATGATTANGPSGTAEATSGNGFVLVGSSTAATLGSNAVRNAQTPLIARLLIGILHHLPL